MRDRVSLGCQETIVTYSSPILDVPSSDLLLSTKHPVVLCVDDNNEILDLLSEVLSLQGYVVKCESDPWRAFQSLQCLDVDAVIVDYDMPGMTGSELARLMHREKPDVPVLMFSGSVLPPEGLEAVWTFISKNQGVKALIDALRAAG